MHRDASRRLENAVTTLDRPCAVVLTLPVELLTAQLLGLDLWHAARRRTEQSVHQPGMSREARLDADRRRDVRAREHLAIVERTALACQESLRPMPSTVPTRAVVAHRHAWTRDRLASELADRGVEVLCALENGADVVGVCVVEQPALLIVDELLAMRSGCEVSQEVARLSPNTVVGGYVPREDASAPLIEAGAAAVFTRQTPPAEVVDHLVGLVLAAKVAGTASVV